MPVSTFEHQLIHRALVTRNGVFMFYLDLCEVGNNVYKLLMKDDDGTSAIEHSIDNYEKATEIWNAWKQKHANMKWEVEVLIYNGETLRIRPEETEDDLG